MCSKSCDLLTLPMELVDNSEYEPQRCFIPTALLVECSPSAWYKCELHDGSFSICRLATRPGSETCCFMDNVVSSSSDFTAANKQLSRLIPLEPAEKPEKLACVVTINEKLLHRPQSSLTALSELVRIFLNDFMLADGCFVQHKRLYDLGIASVEIFDVPGLAANQCFEMSKDTALLIVDVRLVSSAKLPRAVFHTCGFERPLRALEDLLHSSQSVHAGLLPLNALLVGPVGSGKSTLLAEFMRRKGCNCFYITASQVLRAYPGETEAELRKIFEAAHTYDERFKPLLNTIILLEDLELFCPMITSDSKNSTNALRISAQLYKLIDDLHRRSKRIICLATSSSPESLHEHARRAGRFGNEISIDMPTDTQRRQLFEALFRTHYPQHKLNDNILELVAQQTQGYVVADLALLLRKIENEMLLHSQDDEPINMDTLIQQALQQCQPSASRSSDVRVLKTTLGFESIGGMNALKRTLRISVLAGLKQNAAFSRFGLSMPKGVLFYGPPGCAKTSIAKCLAKEANMTFIATSAAEVYSPYVGCAERFIARIFDTARKNAPCLIFLDEIDSLVGRRTVNSAGSSGDVQMRILSTLLTEMDGIVSGASKQHIIVVAATNRPEMIDAALLRPGRFDKLIHVPAPDHASRLALLEMHAQRMPFDATINLQEIATRTHLYSGADLCNLCNEAAIQAFQRDFDTTSIEMQDFETVLSNQKSSLTQSQIDGYYKFAYRFL